MIEDGHHSSTLGLGISSVGPDGFPIPPLQLQHQVLGKASTEPDDVSTPITVLLLLQICQVVEHVLGPGVTHVYPNIPVQFCRRYITKSAMRKELILHY